MIKNIKIFFCIFIFIFFNKEIIADSALDITEDDFYIGNQDAPVTIIEYASLSCNHCAEFHLNTLPKIKEEYIDSGKVRFVFRDFPLNLPALYGSMVLKCVPEDFRYAYQEALYQLQNTWVIRESAKSNKELFKIMQSGGMSKEEFDNCISNTELEQKILQVLMDAQEEFDIKSTPTFIINGEKLGGNKDIKVFRQIIDKILSQ